MPVPWIAIIDDDPDIQALLRTLLRREGYHSCAWTRGEGAHEFIRGMQPDRVILDLWLEHPQAVSMVLGLLAIDPATQHIPVIVCTAFPHLLPAQVQHLATHGYLVLQKPFKTQELLSHIEHILTPIHTQDHGA